MLFFRIETLELDEVAERTRIETAFSGRSHTKNRSVLLAILDCVVRDDLDSACAAYGEHMRTYKGDTRFAEYLHPVVYELLATYAMRENRHAMLRAQNTPAPELSGEEYSPAQLKDVLQANYPRLVRFTGQVDLETFKPVDPAALKHT